MPYTISLSGELFRAFEEFWRTSFDDTRITWIMTIPVWVTFPLLIGCPYQVDYWLAVVTDEISYILIVPLPLLLKLALH